MLTASPVCAKVASVSLADLAGDSELIVVARIERVSNPLFGKRRAGAVVSEVWKGAPLEVVEFPDSPTWTCAITYAKKGETAVLFLEKSEGSRSYQIALFGRGQMPQREVSGKTCVDICADVRLPSNAPVEGTLGEYAWIRFVELSTLQKLVQSPPVNKE